MGAPRAPGLMRTPLLPLLPRPASAATTARRNFAPCPGLLTRYAEPSGVPGVRVDAGVAEGSPISIHYDPMARPVVSGV